MIVVGVDPGARTTGLVVVDTRTRTVLDARSITRPPGDMLPVETMYLLDVVAPIFTSLRAHHLENGGDGAIAVETVTRPNWHVAGGRAAVNPEAVMATAQVLGAILGRHYPVPLVQVPPGRNGSAPLAAYPDDLVSDAERRQQGWRMRVGGGQLRHARSAYDVAMQAPLLLRRATT